MAREWFVIEITGDSELRKSAWLTARITGPWTLHARAEVEVVRPPATRERSAATATRASTPTIAYNADFRRRGGRGNTDAEGVGSGDISSSLRVPARCGWQQEVAHVERYYGARRPSITTRKEQAGSATDDGAARASGAGR